MLASASHSHVIGFTFFVFSIHGRKKHSGQFGTLETSRLATQDGQLKECHPLRSLVKRVSHGNLKTWGEETFNVVSIVGSYHFSESGLFVKLCPTCRGSFKKSILGCCFSTCELYFIQRLPKPSKALQVSGEARPLPFLLVMVGQGRDWMSQHF